LIIDNNTVIIKKSNNNNNGHQSNNINSLLKKGYNLTTKGTTTAGTGIGSGILSSLSQPKSYWKNSSNIRINPKNLAPEYYQKYINGNSTIPAPINGYSSNNSNNLEKSRLLPKIKTEKRVNTILDKKNYSKNNYGNN